MVMLGPHCLEASFIPNKRFVETPHAPHHSPIYIEDQFSLQISHPPPQSHDPITHELEESYTTSTLAK